MQLRISRSQRLIAAITIASAFFLVEISIGFYTHSLALVADAFHYLNDLVGFIVAFVAHRLSTRNDSPQALSFGWQRAQVLGAFFNGSLLFALGISIMLQSIERFITLHQHHHDHHHDHSHEPVVESEPPREISFKGQRLTSASQHPDHRHLTSETKSFHGGHDMGMMGVLLHVLGDAANNLGVMIAALVIWLTRYEGRYYADPATSLGIAVMILLSSLPLVQQSGLILLESAPKGVNITDVKHDLEKVPGVLAVHELHIWRLNQNKVLASVHVAILDHSASCFSRLAKVIQECFHAYGIHSITIQPEIVSVGPIQGEMKELEMKDNYPEICQLGCRMVCKELTCCG
ncbi:hypothetical protein P175DRAFT_0481417 [Aspergillus ochraceoroseus IBT 24754]|uniref:Cation efflux protein cytoplasmic domain-containing protein n=1 Tax=Aspergillus ochraceoroseus IBT 24754 TaxID=1392256 RepID=A0A2T5LVH6_9EURO|nr:uncharacterized protein P175DRAFT_0481417 [Aspergillus ochraceoroseus IBT 24754]PTU20253.1 hypothetical protein P175DRAFT_0481417 [Aspergillus ochraceoroseus IBT 24754]